MFCYRDYQLTARFNQQNEKSTSNVQFAYFDMKVDIEPSDLLA